MFQLRVGFFAPLPPKMFCRFLNFWGQNTNPQKLFLSFFPCLQPCFGSLWAFLFFCPVWGGGVFLAPPRGGCVPNHQALFGEITNRFAHRGKKFLAPKGGVGPPKTILFFFEVHFFVLFFQTKGEFFFSTKGCNNLLWWGPFCVFLGVTNKTLGLGKGVNFPPPPVGLISDSTHGAF